MLQLPKSDIPNQTSLLLRLHHQKNQFAKITEHFTFVKKQIPNLYKLYSFYGEIPYECLDETDADLIFHQNSFDSSKFKHCPAGVNESATDFLPHIFLRREVMTTQ